MFGVPPGILAAGVGSARTYAEWLAHVTGLTSRVFPWGNGASTSLADQFRTTCATPNALWTMGGSPYMNRVRSPSVVARIVQHCFPTEALFLAAVSSGDVVYVSYPGSSETPELPSVDRNGFVSEAAPAGTASGPITVFRYFDRSIGQAFEVNPFAGTAPVPYNW